MSMFFKIAQIAGLLVGIFSIGPPNAVLPPADDHIEQPSAVFDSPLLLPDLQALPPFDLEIEAREDGLKRFLRLSVSVINRGPGALELLGLSDAALGTTSVTQYVYTSDGQRLEVPVGSFVFHPSHGHWHLENFAQYELWSLTYGGVRKQLLSHNDKVSFCLRDIAPVASTEPSDDAAYTECGKDLQGLSLGWLDTYRYHLVGQHIDISVIPDGTYAVRVTFDPADLLLEGREDNNSGQVYVRIQGDRLWVLENDRNMKWFLDPRYR